MIGRTTLILLLVTSLTAIGCASSKDAEEEQSEASGSMETAPADEAEPTDEGAATGAEKTQATDKAEGTEKTELAACTGGNVPQGAKSCLLDLTQGKDTFWSDSDGVDPGTAGCHYEYETDACETLKTERTFGEFCLDEDRLVESNPGADECHRHGADRGKPDVVSCSEWCQTQKGTTGKCQGGVSAEGKGGSCESARCVCSEA